MVCAFVGWGEQGVMEREEEGVQVFAGKGFVGGMGGNDWGLDSWIQDAKELQ